MSTVPVRQLTPLPAPSPTYDPNHEANKNRVVDQNFQQVMGYLAFCPATGSTVAKLPSPTNYPYLRAVALDSTLSATGNFGAAVVGGGSHIVPVWSDGSTWYIG